MNKKKIIILLGPPGVGKGTISQSLSDSNYNFKHISLGSICRLYASKDDELGMLIKSRIDAGNLIDISLVEIIINKIFEDFLLVDQDLECTEILVLDGFPRTFEQVFLFLKLFNQYCLSINFYIIFLHLNHDILKKRLINRYVCSNAICDKIYSLNKEYKDEFCMKCNSNLYQRKDDTEDIIMNRLLIHSQEEIKIINYFNENNIIYFQIDGSNKIEKIIDNIYEILDLKNSIIF